MDTMQTKRTRLRMKNGLGEGLFSLLQTILNICSMRAMSLESVLQAQFDKATWPLPPVFPPVPAAHPLKAVRTASLPPSFTSQGHSCSCGKSLVAALLRRLYEPTSGTLSVGGHELRLTDVHHLHNHRS
ncbi:hypothetical protein EV363DRAFT_793594 [Boletus edulis]|nr:hypothetical protein EV363DRAFT_793594 [Boletus edulis]